MSEPSPVSAVQAPVGHHIGHDGHAMFYFDTMDGADIAIYYDGSFNSYTSHGTNPVEGTFDCHGTLEGRDGVELTYSYVSSDLNAITLSGQSYDLGQGRCFVFNTDGTVSQLPFAPIEPTADYLASFNQFLS